MNKYYLMNKKKLRGIDSIYDTYGNIKTNI